MAKTHDGLEAFLSAHRPIRSRGHVAVGQTLGGWMVRAFVGRGGLWGGLSRCGRGWPRGGA